MKYFVYIIISLLTLSILSLFVLKKPDGTAWLRVSDFGQQTTHVTNKFERLKTDVSNKIHSFFEKTDDTEIYKWQDEKGTWHYSDKKEQQSTVWDKPDNLTVIPAFKPTDLPSVDKTKAEENSNTHQQPLNRVDKLLNDANNVQTIMDERNKKIDKAL
jgi:hypothetical protein